MALYGGIEAGGTKFICAVGSNPDNLHAIERIPTTTPAETIARTIDYFRRISATEPLTAIGIASFGPVDPNPRSKTYGYITSTPKPGWMNVNLAGEISGALNLPVAFDTDVNGAAMAEARWGAAQGLDTFIYLTIGTGFGGGGMANGKPMHGLLHPEMGHIRIPHDRKTDPFPGTCPFHGDCLEGLAAGPAIEQRWGQRGETLPIDHPAWNLEAHYLSLGLMNHILMLSPQRIIIGGGVMAQSQLFPLVREKVVAQLNGYIDMPQIVQHIDTYIVPPALGNQAGVLGAIALAQTTFN